MGVFEKLPYLNYHDINLDWLVKQTKKNAADNTKLMEIFKVVEDQGIIGVVTDVTENPDNTVKIDYYDNDSDTLDDFTVYDKTGADVAISGAQSAAESYADNAANTAASNALKSLGDLSAETTLQATDLLLINRSGAAESLPGSAIATPSDIPDPDSYVHRTFIKQINSTDPAVISFSGSTRMLLLFSSGNTDRMAILWVYCSGSSGIPVVMEVGTTGSNISYTAATGTLTLNNSSTSGSYVYAMFMVAAMVENITVN